MKTSRKPKADPKIGADVFTANQFTATQWHTAEEKAAFAAKFVAFIRDRMPYSGLTRDLYNRLSCMFGHIAHTNRGGFYAAWFASDPDRLDFLKRIQTWRVYGDPAWTWCDVEAAVQAWLVATPAVVAGLQERCDAALTSAEKDVLQRLVAKYPGYAKTLIQP